MMLIQALAEMQGLFIKVFQIRDDTLINVAVNPAKRRGGRLIQGIGRDRQNLILHYARHCAGFFVFRLTGINHYVLC